MENRKPVGDFGIRVTPLPSGAAAALWVLFYVSGTFLWAALPPDFFSGMRRHPEIIAMAAVPLGLLLLRWLFEFFAGTGFAWGMASALGGILIAAAGYMGPRAALENVFRTFPFAALVVSLALSILAQILKRRWRKAAAGLLAFYILSFIALAGLLCRILGCA